MMSGHIYIDSVAYYTEYWDVCKDVKKKKNNWPLIELN